MSIPFNFRLTDFPVEAETLRLEVREFLSTALADVPKRQELKLGMELMKLLVEKLVKEVGLV